MSLKARIKDELGPLRSRRQDVCRMIKRQTGVSWDEFTRHLEACINERYEFHKVHYTLAFCKEQAKFEKRLLTIRFELLDIKVKQGALPTLKVIRAG